MKYETVILIKNSFSIMELQYLDFFLVINYKKGGKNSTNY